jgi:hypothetical protein
MRKQLSRASLIAAVFGIGTACGGVASRYVGVANAAPPPPGTPLWVYRCVTGNDALDVEAAANSFGQEGWELAAGSASQISPPIWCFKRRR